MGRQEGGGRGPKKLVESPISPAKKSKHKESKRPNQRAKRQQNSPERTEDVQGEAECQPTLSPAKPPRPVLLPPPGLPLLPCQVGEGSDEVPNSGKEMKYLDEGYLKLYRGGQPQPKKRSTNNNPAANEKYNQNNGGYLQEAMNVNIRDKNLPEKMSNKNKNNLSRIEVFTPRACCHIMSTLYPR